MEYIFKSTQEQGTAQAVSLFNELRNKLLSLRLTHQDASIGLALKELDAVRDFISQPNHILGSSLTKHGEVAEQMQVAFSNARKLILGLDPEYTFQNVGRFAPIDFLVKDADGFYKGVQFKSIKSARETIDHLKTHLDKYPDFLDEGSYFMIPENRHEEIMKVLTKKTTELRRSEVELVARIREFEKRTGQKFEECVKPAVINYKDSQLNVAEKTVDDEETQIRGKDGEQRERFHREAVPSLNEALKAAAIGAALEGGSTFIFAVVKNHKAGKRIAFYNGSDWFELGKDTAAGFIKGAIRGGGVYALTNFLSFSAPAATSLITIAYGIASQTACLCKGTTGVEDFVINAESVIIEATISAAGATVGQILIPIPVAGDLIGNAVLTAVYSFLRNDLRSHENDGINRTRETLTILDQNLAALHSTLSQAMSLNQDKFKTLASATLNNNPSQAFAAALLHALCYGIPTEKLLGSMDDIRRYFMG